MRTKIVKWGNSLGLRIPKSFAEELNVKDGTQVDLALDGERLVVRAIERPQLELNELLEGISDANLHGEIDSGDPAGDEVW